MKNKAYCDICRMPPKTLPHIHCSKCSASPENIKETSQAESRWLGYDIVLYKCSVCNFEYKKEIL